ncbi:MAG: DUF389 domain-containing protein [Streptosporangiales bacterium]|nr:DUF389 domain-containing protein [Streptosporangiales bacterium]
MLHLRVIAPAGQGEDVVAFLVDCPMVTNIVVLPGVAREPRGDLILADVAREGANTVLHGLEEQGIPRDGSIAVETIDLSLSARADKAEEDAPGHEDDAVVWAEFEERVAEGSRLTWAFVTFLALATQIAAIGVLLDSTILIVGAMVLGPEFAAIAAICYGIIRPSARLIGRALRTLAAGFAIAIIVTMVCAAFSAWWGWITPAMLDHNEQTDFIVSPDRWSFIVAVLAGAAGVLSVTAGKSSALVGVFISVTTVPAAGNLAVAIVLVHFNEVGDSLLQLGVNVAGMLIAGTVTLVLQRLVWSRLSATIPVRRARPPHHPRTTPHL